MGVAVRDRASAGAADAVGISVPLPDLLAIVREYIGARRLDAAERLLAHVLASAPGHAEALHLRGFIAFRQRRMDDAAILMEAALAAGANTPRQLGNLAEVYRVLGRLDAGLDLVRRASAMAPTDAVHHFTEAMLRYDRQELDLCIRAARRAIALKHDMAEAHMRLGQALLATGAFAEGWEEYEWRYRIADAQPLFPPGFLSGQRPWDGRMLGRGQALLLVADQGFGDVLMFSRLLPWAMARCADAVVVCGMDLVDLLRRAYPGPRYVTQWAEIPGYAAYCPFSGLPRLVGTTPDAVCGSPPYLTADAGKRAAMLAWLRAETPAATLRVGLAWAGRPSHPNDRNRSMPLDALIPLAAVAGISWVSLQKGAAGAQLSGAPMPILDAGAGLHSFEHTAALVDCLDLVIAVDTSVAHLAGALGKPVWIMLPFAADWRWMVGRHSSAWYSSCRLLRQPAPGNWDGALSVLSRDLQEFVESARDRRRNGRTCLQTISRADIGRPV